MRVRTPNSTAQTQNSTVRLVTITVGGIIVFLVVLWVAWDLWNRHPRSFNCGDGQRFTIDTRDFATKYSAYSLQLEASLNGRAKVSVKLDPVQQEKLSEAIQSANEFRKYVVAGFNSCAVNTSQYVRVGARFQALDSLAHQIDGLLAKSPLTAAESASVSKLITQYSDLAHNLGSE